MSSVASISLSGMNAAKTALDAFAHNIANGSTSGFRRQLVAQSTAPNGGVMTALTQASEAGSALESDMVGQLVAKNAFLANLLCFEAANRCWVRC